MAKRQKRMQRWHDLEVGDQIIERTSWRLMNERRTRATEGNDKAFMVRPYRDSRGEAHLVERVR